MRPFSAQNKLNNAQIKRSIFLTFQSVDRQREKVYVDCLNEAVCSTWPPLLEVDLNPANGYTNHLNVSILGKFVGITRLLLRVGNRTFNNYEIKVLRSDWEHQKADIFLTVLVVFIPTVTFMMGTQLKLDNILAIWKRPFSPCISLICQFCIMPLVAYALAKFLLAEEGRAIQLALFAAGTCPGGGKSSFWTIIFGGNLDLSVSLTFAQNFVALIAMPIWIGTLGQEFSTESLRVPYSDIFEALIILLVPTVCGMIFIHYKADWYLRVQKLVKIIVWIGTFILFFTSIYANLYIIFLLNWRILLAGCLLPWSGYLIAFTVASIFRMEFKDKITIAIETGIQHVSIAMVILLFTFPEPEVDLAMVILFVTVLMTDKPLLLLYCLLRCYRRLRPEKKEEEVDESPENSVKETFTEISLIDGHKEKPTDEKTKSNLEINRNPSLQP